MRLSDAPFPRVHSSTNLLRSLARRARASLTLSSVLPHCTRYLGLTFGRLPGRRSAGHSPPDNGPGVHPEHSFHPLGYLRTSGDAPTGRPVRRESLSLSHFPLRATQLQTTSHSFPPSISAATKTTSRIPLFPLSSRCATILKLAIPFLVLSSPSARDEYYRGCRPTFPAQTPLGPSHVTHLHYVPLTLSLLQYSISRSSFTLPIVHPPHYSFITLPEPLPPPIRVSVRTLRYG